ncbi:hypothetical protein DENSPDRAFT_842624 [Dentipellis sp. KUC8613]|nr:hypothetical protein DENSPDRAFT_842624 [Dentipellis sp. KUC8613]
MEKPSYPSLSLTTTLPCQPVLIVSPIRPFNNPTYAQVHDLPTELLCRIFEFCACPEPNVIATPHTFQPQYSPRWTQIMHVCRLWREVALSLTRLWTIVDFVCPQWTSTFLKHAKGLPITVVVDYSKLDMCARQHSLRQLFEHVDKIHTLSVDLHEPWDLQVDAELSEKMNNPAPNLQSLTLMAGRLSPLPGVELPFGLFSGLLPNLRRLHLKGSAFVRILLNSTYLPNLCALEIDDGRLSLPELKAILDRFPELQRLSLRSTIAFVEGYTDFTTLSPMPGLVHFEVTKVDPFVWDHCIKPALPPTIPSLKVHCQFTKRHGMDGALELITSAAAHAAFPPYPAGSAPALPLMVSIDERCSRISDARTIGVVCILGPVLQPARVFDLEIAGPLREPQANDLLLALCRALPHALAHAALLRVASVVHLSNFDWRAILELMPRLKEVAIVSPSPHYFIHAIGGEDGTTAQLERASLVKTTVGAHTVRDVEECVAARKRSGACAIKWRVQECIVTEALKARINRMTDGRVV